MTRPRTKRRRMLRAMLARRRRFTTHSHGVFETPAGTITIHEMPKP